MVFNKKFFIVMLLFLVLLGFSFSSGLASSEFSVSVTIVEAEENLTLAYESVTKAEDAGADVSSLVDKLSLGGQYLVDAYMWTRFGDVERGDRLAGFCNEIVSGVSEEAIELEYEAIRLSEIDFVSNIFWSVFLFIIFISVCFVSWIFFKKWYNRRILLLKPEVVSHES